MDPDVPALAAAVVPYVSIVVTGDDAKITR